VCADPKLTPAEKLVAVRFSMYLKNGIVWASRDRLAGDCHLSPATVQRHRRTLTDRGMIAIETPAAQHHAARYRLAGPESWCITADTSGDGSGVSPMAPGVSNETPSRIKSAPDVSPTTPSRITADTRQERQETPRQGRSTGLDTSADPASAGALPVASSNDDREARIARRLALYEGGAA
jgi:hypothetical protein